MVHFYRNVFSVTPSHVKEVAAMLKAIHGQEDSEAALEKSKQVVEKLRIMKLRKAAECQHAFRNDPWAIIEN